jgi:sterol desaturase/sphingolipid hydroxylase (fatty acid hydroxylase superfamily)
MLNGILDSSLLRLTACTGLGWLCWPFVEYLIHGILSHRFRTPVSPLHWGHHRTPAAVFTSPIAWVPTAAGVFALAAWAIGVAPAAAFMTGLLAGFARYEYVHWRIHFREPRTKRQARLRSHHLAHHFVNFRAYHGVTTRFWDHVFGSLPEGWERDYARAAGRPPLEGPSNLRASWSPRATWTVVKGALRSGSPR